MCSSVVGAITKEGDGIVHSKIRSAGGVEDHNIVSATGDMRITSSV